jgi:RNA polymerase sigma factor (sigma-70 family)
VLSLKEKEEFINQILAENSRKLLSIAREYAPADEDMDLYQEILYELWESLYRFEGRSGPRTWACAIALNKAHAYVRKIGDIPLVSRFHFAVRHFFYSQ